MKMAFRWCNSEAYVKQNWLSDPKAWIWKKINLKVEEVLKWRWIEENIVNEKKKPSDFEGIMKEKLMCLSIS